MTNKTKKILIITGLIVWMIITILTDAESSHRENEPTSNINPPKTQVLVSTGAKWIMQTTYKFLKPIQ